MTGCGWLQQAVAVVGRCVAATATAATEKEEEEVEESSFDERTKEGPRTEKLRANALRLSAEASPASRLFAPSRVELEYDSHHLFSRHLQCAVKTREETRVGMRHEERAALGSYHGSW